MRKLAVRKFFDFLRTASVKCFERTHGDLIS